MRETLCWIKFYIMKTFGEWRRSSMRSEPWHWMEVSFILHPLYSRGNNRSTHWPVGCKLVITLFCNLMILVRAYFAVCRGFLSDTTVTFPIATAGLTFYVLKYLWVTCRNYHYFCIEFHVPNSDGCYLSSFNWKLNIHMLWGQIRVL
jgi:hypothetical protein